MTASAGVSAAALGPLQERIPDFFIVGHPKSGTTALYEMLRRHPQIHMPIKEPWFFARDLRLQSGDGLPETFEDYVSLFAAARPEQRVGEATLSYLRSPTAARRIADAQPAARIIAILREPASFVRSLHLQFLQSDIEAEKDLRKALSLEDARREGRDVPRSSHLPETFLYRDRVRYVEQLRRYHAVFPAEQVLVLIYEDFRRDNEATIREVLRFLELDAPSRVETIEANPTVGLRSPRLNHMMEAVSVGAGPVSGLIKTSVKALTPRPLRRGALRATRQRILYGQPRPPDEDLMLELRRHFKGEVVALSEYLGRDLVSTWGYDDVS
jgi:Sulfotransferase domain